MSHSTVRTARIDPCGVYHGSANFPYTEGFLQVTYTNDAQVAAREIDFGLVSRGSLIAVAKDFVDPQILPYCAVLNVKYADGTQWSNPRSPI